MLQNGIIGNIEGERVLVFVGRRKSEGEKKKEGRGRLPEEKVFVCWVKEPFGAGQKNRRRR